MSTAARDQASTGAYRRRMRTVQTLDLGDATLDDRALDDALARIADLTSRLHAVADLHVARRSLLGRTCRACARPYPCPTVQVSRR